MTTRLSIVKVTEKFCGKLFYAIIPNQNSKSVTFYFSKVNSDEARDSTSGLFLFVRDYFKLDPGLFCLSDAMTTSLEGFWDYDYKSFLAAKEK